MTMTVYLLRVILCCAMFECRGRLCFKTFGMMVEIIANRRLGRKFPR